MPEYKIGGQTVRRKNLYMPCVLGPRFETMSAAEGDEERVALRVDLFTPMCCEHLPQEALLIGQQFPVQASA